MQRRQLVLVATCLASFTATLDNTVVAVALRDIQRDLGAGVSGLQGVVTAYTVTLAALLLTGGTLVDVLGRRRVFLTGLTVFGASSLACALAGSMTQLIVARAVQGAGAALVIPGSLAVLAQAYPEAQARARAVGIWAATGALALALGPIAGGLLVQARGWPAVFEVNVPLCVAVAAVVLLGRTEPGEGTGRRLDLPGQALVALGLGASTYAVVLAGRDGWRPAVGAWAIAGVLALVGFLAVERRTADPLLPAGLLRQRAFVGTSCAAFATSLALFVLLVFLSLFLQLVQELDALPAALRLLPLTVGLVVAAPLAVRFRRTTIPVVTGMVVAGLGLGGLAAALSPDISAPTLTVGLTVIGIGLGFAGAPVVVASLDAVSSTRRGLAAATVNAARELGGVVAIGGIGALVVSRLGNDLTARLLTLGVPRTDASGLVESVLRGEPALEVARRAGPTVDVNALLQLRGLAAQSYVTSTRAALLGAGVVLLLAAGVAARSLGGPAPGRATSSGADVPVA